MKIFVGLSGGVDSAVSAALLKEAGHEVTGCFIRTWTPDWMPCTQADDRIDALRVATHLKIPFIEIDAVEAYKTHVVDYLVQEYKEGRTPNPDIMCNTFVKFGIFYEEAKRLGAEGIATGHYVRKSKIQNDKLQTGAYDLRSTNYELLTGLDTNKDQSYFLWNISQEALAFSHFPVGELKKPEVRQKAEALGLPNARKKDSQGLCMMGGVDMRSFLEHFIELKPGQVLSESGEVIGHHDSAIPLTLGQRHGFTITTKTPNDPAHYVIAKDIEANTITVAPEPQPTQPQVEVSLIKTNWFKEPPTVGTSLEARLRYRQPLFPITITSIGESCALITLDEAQLVPEGQSLVVYDGERVVGGGIIT